MNTESKTILEFTQELASSSPAPGGGGAAAIAAALAASLCSMAGSLTVGKKKFIPVEDDIRKIISRCSRLSSTLIGLADKDEEVFLPLSKAYSLPKDTPNRDRILYEASMTACTAAEEIMNCCCEIVQLLEEMFEIGSRMMISDVGCGALLCASALEAASLNIYVNTKSFRGIEEADALEKRVSAMLEEYLPRARSVSDAVMKELKGE